LVEFGLYFEMSKTEFRVGIKNKKGRKD